MKEATVTDSPLGRAAGGLGLVFAAVVFQYLAALTQVFLLTLVKDPRWALLPALTWTAAALLELAGRWSCRKAGASLATKRWLRLSVVLTILALAFNLAFMTVVLLLLIGTISADQLNGRAVAVVAWAQLPVPLVGVGATAVFLTYLHGLARAQEFNELANEALAVLVLGALVYVGIIPLILIVLLLLQWIDFWLLNAVLRFLWPASLVAIVFLVLWPLIRYCNLLTSLREVFQLKLADEAKRQKPTWKP